VAINEKIKGPNAIFTPWEGQGAHAIESAALALQRGHAACALAGGCDARTHELSLLSLKQLGLFDSWPATGDGITPGEGAVFLVLELDENARRRKARQYAQVNQMGIRTHSVKASQSTTYTALFKGARLAESPYEVVVSSEDGTQVKKQNELHSLHEAGIQWKRWLAPKNRAGDLFAAAAFLQVAAGALSVDRHGGRCLANGFGYGSEQSIFELEKP
jgi:3-oxoacyl-(acyl-carrier-protein) synthase